MDKTKLSKIPVDYSRIKVPEDKTVKGIQIASIICLLYTSPSPRDRG